MLTSALFNNSFGVVLDEESILENINRNSSSHFNGSNEANFTQLFGDDENGYSNNSQYNHTNVSNLNNETAINISNFSNEIAIGGATQRLQLMGSNTLYGSGNFYVNPGFSNALNYKISGACNLWLDPCTMRSQMKINVTILDGSGAAAFPNFDLLGMAHNQSCLIPTFNSYYRRFPQYKGDIPLNQIIIPLVGSARSNLSEFYAFPPQNKPASCVIHHPITKESMFCCTFQFRAYPLCTRRRPACPSSCLVGLIFTFCGTLAVFSFCLSCHLKARVSLTHNTAPRADRVGTLPISWPFGWTRTTIKAAAPVPTPELDSAVKTTVDGVEKAAAMRSPSGEITAE